MVDQDKINRALEEMIRYAGDFGEVDKDAGEFTTKWFAKKRSSSNEAALKSLHTLMAEGLISYRPAIDPETRRRCKAWRLTEAGILFFTGQNPVDGPPLGPDGKVQGDGEE